VDDLPSDVPRLRTLEHYLLQQLAAVRDAIEEADTPAGDADTGGDVPRWVITWQWVPRGQPRTGRLHRQDCWAAKGEPLTIRQVAEARRTRRIINCDLCHPTDPPPPDRPRS
jgi:hypothetical protein